MIKIHHYDERSSHRYVEIVINVLNIVWDSLFTLINFARVYLTVVWIISWMVGEWVGGEWMSVEWVSGKSRSIYDFQNAFEIYASR